MLGLAFVDALLVRASATEVAGRQDVAKTPAQDAQPSTRSVREGVYSVAQAVRGEKTFDTQCALCHKPEHFVGDFLKGWDGQRASGMFEMIRTSMPVNDPGGLARQDYADIVAFILKTNGLPAGAEELSSKSVELKRIIINVPAKPGAVD